MLPGEVLGLCLVARGLAAAGVEKRLLFANLLGNEKCINSHLESTRLNPRLNFHFQIFRISNFAEG